MIPEKDLELFEKKMQDENFHEKPGSKIVMVLFQRIKKSSSDSARDEWEAEIVEGDYSQA